MTSDVTNRRRPGERIANIPVTGLPAPFMMTLLPASWCSASDRRDGIRDHRGHLRAVSVRCAASPSFCGAEPARQFIGRGLKAGGIDSASGKSGSAVAYRDAAIENGRRLELRRFATNQRRE